MSDERRILRNTGLLTIGEALGQLTNLLFVASFARTYGVAVMGEYSLAMAIGAIAGLAVSFGATSYLLRELSQAPELAARRIATIAPWQLLSAFGAFVLTAAALQLGGALSTVMLTTIAYQLLLRVANLYFVGFRARERMLTPVAAEFAQRLMTLLLGAALMHAGASAQTTVLAMLGSSAVHVVTGCILSRRAFGTARPPPGRDELLPLLRASWPFFGTAVMGVLYARGAPILLGIVHGTESVGSYAAADRLLVAATLVPSLFGMAALPALSRIAHHDRVHLRTIAARLLRLMLVGTLFVAALMVSFAHDIVAIVFGASYTSATVVLQILALIVPVQGVEMLLTGEITALGGQRALLRNRLMSLSCFFLLGPVVVHFAGSPGLAVTVLFCSAIQTSGCALIARQTGASPLGAGIIWPPLLCAALAALATLPLAGHSLFLRAGAFVITLLISARAFGAIRGHDISFARSLLKSRRETPKSAGSDPAA